MEQMLEKVQEAINLNKVNNPIIKAIAEDENCQRESRNRSRSYLKLVEKEKNHMPEWMWNALWFILGMFFWESIPALVGLGHALIKLQGGLP